MKPHTFLFPTQFFSLFYIQNYLTHSYLRKSTIKEEVLLMVLFGDRIWVGIWGDWGGDLVG